MRFIVSVLFLVFVIGYKRQESHSLQVEENPQDTKLDPLVFCLTKNYENLRCFIHDEKTNTVFDPLFGDVCADFESRVKADSKPGTWLNQARINKRGTGMLSVFGDLDEPASVSIVRHRPDSPEVTISKQARWDRIMLGETEYTRKCERQVYIHGHGDGILSVEITFGIYASSESECYDVQNFSGCFEYQLVGRYETTPGCEALSSGSTILFHYNPNKLVEKEHLGTKYTGPELVSRNVFRQGGIELSETSKRHLLKIMDMVTVYGIDQPGNAVYKELLKREPLELAR